MLSNPPGCLLKYTRDASGRVQEAGDTARLPGAEPDHSGEHKPHTTPRELLRPGEEVLPYVALENDERVWTVAEAVQVAGSLGAPPSQTHSTTT